MLMTDDKQTLDDFESLQDMMQQHRGVLKSIINRDGFYKMKEAVEINNGVGKQLNFLKIILESYKMLGVKPAKKDLFLK